MSVSRADLEAGPLLDVADPAPVVASERVFAGAVWDVVRESAEFGDGTIRREFLAHTGAVAVLAIDADDRVLLINQYRHPIRQRNWELPAGLLDVPGEPTLDAARRELAEEADLAADWWSPLVSFHSSPGGSSEVIHVFEARDLRPTPEAFARTDEEAQIVVRWVPFDEAVAAVLDGRLRNGPLTIALLAAHARR